MSTKPLSLKLCPFRMTPDPAFLFMTQQHQEALIGLAHALLESWGFVVLTGDAGTGKTTLLFKLLKSFPADRVQFSFIINPTLTPTEFLEMVLLDFGIKEVPPSKPQRLLKLQDLLAEGRSRGRISALIVDEAHKLSSDVLEEIRLLGNFEEPDRKLLQVILVGQPELDLLLNHHELRQFRQRLALRMTIGPLSEQEVSRYIQHRWTVAGGDAAPFSEEALREIALVSRGIPRVINNLCESALAIAFADGAPNVHSGHVEAANLQLSHASGNSRRMHLTSSSLSSLGEAHGSIDDVLARMLERADTEAAPWHCQPAAAPETEVSTKDSCSLQGVESIGQPTTQVVEGNPHIRRLAEDVPGVDSNGDRSAAAAREATPQQSGEFPERATSDLGYSGPATLVRYYRAARAASIRVAVGWKWNRPQN